MKFNNFDNYIGKNDNEYIVLYLNIQQILLLLVLLDAVRPIF